MESGGSSSWLYGLPGIIFIHFLNTGCFFLIASQLKFARRPPALLPQGALVCCTLLPWGSLAFPASGFSSLELKQVWQQSLTTAQGSAKLVPSPGNDKNHIYWAMLLQSWGSS